MLDFMGVNWIAVVVAAVAIIVVGFIWYLPQVFGTRWAALSGRELPSFGQVPPLTYVAGLVTALVTAYVLALFVGATGAATAVDGAIVGLVAWVGFVAAASYNGVLFEGQRMAHWAVNNGNFLIGAVVAGAIIGYLGPM